MEYKYPGTSDDKSFSEVVKEFEPVYDYWAISEEYVLSFADRFIKENKFKKFLDLGCGEGRLTERFYNSFKSHFAIDPDRERLKTAQKNLASVGIYDVNFICSDITKEHFPEGSFDVVLISHVIQHIHTDKVEELINKVYRILSPNGIIILTTSHACGEQDRFLASEVVNNVLTSRPVSRESYNNLVNNRSEILPVHLFSIETLKKYLTLFTIHETKVFHIFNFPALLERTLRVFSSSNLVVEPFVNRFPIKKRYGIDIFLLAQKT